ncbi:MAG: ATP-binding protein [Candidatus Thermoplasmatota archaeon]|nr:ATP-binding protein [Candidatus Thermoplasmatota archaeon]
MTDDPIEKGITECIAGFFAEYREHSHLDEKFSGLYYWNGRDIDNYLRQGENQFVGFKRQFNPDKSSEFHESVSALANTKGGCDHGWRR